MYRESIKPASFYRTTSFNRGIPIPASPARSRSSTKLSPLGTANPSHLSMQPTRCAAYIAKKQLDSAFVVSFITVDSASLRRTKSWNELFCVGQNLGNSYKTSPSDPHFASSSRKIPLWSNLQKNVLPARLTRGSSNLSDPQK